MTATTSLRAVLAQETLALRETGFDGITYGGGIFEPSGMCAPSNARS
jgi:hypothetical protein